MTDIADLHLGLPSDIEAEIGDIESGADDLDQLRQTMLGDAETTDTQFRTASGEFTDLIAWNIVTASSTELMAWEEATKALTYGAGTLRLWASDIGTYRAERASIQRRWDEAKADAESAASNISSKPNMHGPLSSAPIKAEKVEELETLRTELLTEHSGRWETLMEQADQTKKDLRDGPGEATLERLVEVGLLTGAQLAYLGDAVPSMVPDELTGDEPPAVVNLWWTSMTEEEQRQAMEDHPELLRDLDGIPATVRDELNREHLDDEIERMEEEVVDLRQEIRDNPGPAGSFTSVENSRLIRELEADISTLRGLRNNVEGTELESDPEDREHHEHRFLLALDTENAGRAIVAHGNPDSADNVGTLVPGTNADWRSVNGQFENAGEIAKSTYRTAPDANHSVITWIGYDAPEDFEAAGTEHAENAVEELGGFQDGLRTTHQDTSPSHNTVIGHSYGSTVVGHTAWSERGLNADEIVLVGSPGSGSTHADHLGLPAENVHTATAENDKITWVTGFTHGSDPTGDEFGANTFESSPGSKGGKLPFGAAHSEYFDNESDSVERIGEILAGQANGN